MSEAPTFTDIEKKRSDIENILQSIAPEVVAHDGEAIRRSKVLRKRLEDLKHEEQVRTLADMEQRRRANEVAAQRDYEEREQARKQFVAKVDDFLEIERKIVRLIDDLLAECGHHKDTARRLQAIGNKANTQGIGATREGFANQLKDYLRGRLMDLLPELRGDRAVAPLDRQHDKWAERARNSLGAPLGERVRPASRQTVEASPTEAVWFVPPPTRGDRGQEVPQSVLVTYDGTLRKVQNPSQTQIKEARRFYRGGMFNVVAPEDVDLLLRAGYELKKGLIFATGAYEVTETLKREEVNATAE